MVNVILVLLDRHGERFLTIEHPCHGQYALMSASHDTEIDVNLLYTALRAYVNFIHYPLPQFVRHSVRHIHLTPHPNASTHVFVMCMKTSWDRYLHEILGTDYDRYAPVVNRYTQWHNYDLSNQEATSITSINKLLMFTLHMVPGLGTQEIYSEMHSLYPYPIPRTVFHPSQSGPIVFLDLTPSILETEGSMGESRYRAIRSSVF